MYIAQRILPFMHGVVKRYAPSQIKRFLWDKEFSGGKWNFIDNTVGDCVYPHLERYVAHGCVLDLGCGPGNTATELTATYRYYVGVDISEEALSKARRRTEESGRAAQNQFARADFLSYVPTQQFDVILFRESMYHVPMGKVTAIIDRYSAYLKDGGVFIVRMFTSGGNHSNSKHRPKAMIRVIETEYEVVEKRHYGESGATVIVFRPRV